MSNTPTCKWNGKSGTRYTYYIHAIGTPMKDVDGNYIYAYLGPPDAKGNRYWHPVYIGQGNLKERSDTSSHHKGYCITQAGATHFHAHTNGIKSDRLAEERDLLANYNTPCND